LRIVIVNDTLADAQALDDLLWTFNERSFVPHKVCLDEHSADPAAKVHITLEPTNAPLADLLVNLTARLPTHWERYPRICRDHRCRRGTAPPRPRTLQVVPRPQSNAGDASTGRDSGHLIPYAT